MIKLKYLVVAIFMATSWVTTIGQVKITDGAVLTMDPNSLLELESSTRGLMIPRMAINNLSLPAPLTAPVPVGMQVYNNSATTTNGFYYWTGSNWKSYNNPTVPISKSASTTLLKTETLVLATGNNTILNLPAVTSADDGLEITVKNVGTYTDLISVVAGAGKLMDNTDTSRLTRWVGRIYIASGSNWIVRSKETRPDNQYEVSNSGSFKTVAEVVAFLGAHMFGPSLVKLGGAQSYPIAATQTVNLPYPVTFEGLSFGESHVTGSAGVSGSPLFICQTECYFKMLVFVAFSNATGNDAIRFTGVAKYHEVKDCDFSGFNKGIVSTNNSGFWLFENTFEDCTSAAIEIAAGAASGGVLEMSNNDFTRCKTGINLLSGVSEIISIMANNFYNTTGGTDTAFRYKPSTFTAFKSLGFINNFWNNQGGFVAGFDFTRPDGRDANAFIEYNAGMQDEAPSCKINVVNNLTTTFCATANQWYKANWTNTSSITTKFTIGNNIITYQPLNIRDVTLFISGNVQSTGANRTITVGIVKNGLTTLRYGETTLRTGTANQAFQYSTVIFIPNVTKNDYFEFYCSSTNNFDNLIFQDYNEFVSAK